MSLDAVEGFMRAFLLSAFAFGMAGPVFAQECQKEPIKEFFPKFAASIELQEASVGDMVLMGFMNPDAQPEPQLETILLPKIEVEWPVVPNLTVFLRNGGTIEYQLAAQDEYFVTLKGDGGYLVSLTFVGPCWELRSVMNESL